MNKRFGFIKPSNDAHTLGIQSVVDVLKKADQHVLIAPLDIAMAAHDFRHEIKRDIVCKWILDQQIDHVAFSYRLDVGDAIDMIGYFMQAFASKNMMVHQHGSILKVYFAGLPQACKIIESKYGDQVITFMGGETLMETLEKLDVSTEDIFDDLWIENQYDEALLRFGKELIVSGDHRYFDASRRWSYPGHGGKKDSLIKRLDANETPYLPLIRAHVGPYDSQATRQESIDRFLDWVDILAKNGSLDILSIGTSQLSQSHFNQDWTDLPNGGGVPIQYPHEFEAIYQASRPMLVRTYAGTSNLVDLAKMYEQTINISWHALSLWWFNKLDGRGPYDLYTNLKAHFETMAYIATTKKPMEANVSHHFAFRGADDITYIVSNYLCAKLAKQMGIRHFVCQNMLNTPRFTWGIQDLAKARAMLLLIKPLEDKHFKVIHQPRAGLDYFKPDIDKAKIQLAAVSALMDDIDPHNHHSPPIIHVVSYSEALFLATPEVIHESIQITQHAIASYRRLRQKDAIRDMSHHPEIDKRVKEMLDQAKKLIHAIENLIPDPYSPEGFYLIFASGFLPVPYLWQEVEEFKYAKNWNTQPHQGGMVIADENDQVMDIEKRIDIAKHNIDQAKQTLSKKVLAHLK